MGMTPESVPKAIFAPIEMHGGNLTLETSDLLFLFDGLGQHSSLRAFLENVVVVVDVKTRKSVLLGEGDAFVIDQAGMLDGIDASPDGVFDGLRAVSVSATLRPSLWASSAMACISSRVNGESRLIAFAENAAGSTDFDDVSTDFTTSRTLAGQPRDRRRHLRICSETSEAKDCCRMAAGDASAGRRRAWRGTLDVASVNTTSRRATSVKPLAPTLRTVVKAARRVEDRCRLTCDSSVNGTPSCHRGGRTLASPFAPALPPSATSARAVSPMSLSAMVLTLATSRVRACASPARRLASPAATATTIFCLRVSLQIRSVADGPWLPALKFAKW